MKKLENGFCKHGIGCVDAMARGVVATVDGTGRDVVLAWLHHWNGCFCLLMVDATTGASEMFPIPFVNQTMGSPFASVLSSRNRFYTHFDSHFLEFDPVKREFSLVRETFPRNAMAMTEDDTGRIWVTTGPDSGMIMYNPANGEFRDYGSVHSENWIQYSRTIAADDSGWIYFGLGITSSQILAFHPDAQRAQPLLAEDERSAGIPAHVYRDQDGTVYALPNAEGTVWHRLHRGQIIARDVKPPHQRKPIVNGLQGLFHRDFPAGRRIEKFDVVERKLVTTATDGSAPLSVDFTYTGEGHWLMCVGATTCGKIVGDSSKWVVYDPLSDTWSQHHFPTQGNAVAAQNDRYYMACYICGLLFEWHPAQPWVVTDDKKDPSANPRLLAMCDPTIYRPHCLLAHPDGHTVIMGGSPAYGHTGGGLLIWDSNNGEHTLLTHKELELNQSIMSLVALPGGRLLCGTGTRAGTGGEIIAKEGKLFILNMATREIEWRTSLIPGIQEYCEMRMGHDGLVYGLADPNVFAPTRMMEEKLFFVFDPQERRLIHQETPYESFGPIHLQQGQSKIHVLDDGRIYILFVKGIAQVDPATKTLVWVTDSPVPITAGGAWSGGCLWFSSASTLYSYKV